MMKTDYTINGIKLVRTQSFNNYIKANGFDNYKDYEKMIIDEYGTDFLIKQLVEYMKKDNLVEYKYFIHNDEPCCKLEKKIDF